MSCPKLHNQPSLPQPRGLLFWLHHHWTLALTPIYSREFRRKKPKVGFRVFFFFFLLYYSQNSLGRYGDLNQQSHLNFKVISRVTNTAQEGVV